MGAGGVRTWCSPIPIVSFLLAVEFRSSIVIVLGGLSMVLGASAGVHYHGRVVTLPVMLATCWAIVLVVVIEVVALQSTLEQWLTGQRVLGCSSLS